MSDEFPRQVLEVRMEAPGLMVCEATENDDEYRRAVALLVERFIDDDQPMQIRRGAAELISLLTFGVPPPVPQEGHNQ